MCNVLPHREKLWNYWFMKTLDFLIDLAFPNASTHGSLKPWSGTMQAVFPAEPTL